MSFSQINEIISGIILSLIVGHRGVDEIKTLSVLIHDRRVWRGGKFKNLSRSLVPDHKIVALTLFQGNCHAAAALF